MKALVDTCGASALVGTNLMSMIESGFQIAFWVIMAVIAILTYRKAKRTILMPIRTEIFKEQLKEISAIIRLFHGKDEMELRDQMANENIFYGNVQNLYDDYAEIYFGIKIDRKSRDYNSPNFPSMEILKEVMGDEYKLMNEHLVTKSSPKNDISKTQDHAWSTYKYGVLYLHKDLVNFRHQLDLIKSPLLPDELIELISQYDKTIHDNCFLIFTIFQNHASEFPIKYPDIETFGQREYYWLRHEYVTQFKALKPQADKILAFIKDYYNIAELKKYMMHH
jgi:hypothetical protein